MRRSAAPSQLLHGNTAKKPRFVPPAPVNTGAVPTSNPGPVPTSSPGQVPTPTPKPALGNVLNKVQKKSLSERTVDIPAVAKVPAVGRALARVLSAVAQEEKKENGLECLSSSQESGQLPDSPSPQQPDLPSTHTTPKPTDCMKGKRTMGRVGGISGNAGRSANGDESPAKMETGHQ